MTTFHELEPGTTQAVLPEMLEQFCIKYMSVDDVRFTDPWALRADQNRKLWLDGDYHSTATQSQRNRMMVTRTLEGYCVTITGNGDDHWGTLTTEELEDNFGGDSEWLPVVHIFDHSVREDELDLTTLQ